MIEDVTKRTYEDKDYVSRYVKRWWDNESAKEGYLEDYKHFLSLLPKNSLILDAGCGAGMASYFFVNRGYKTIGVDYSGAMVKKARELVPHCEFYKMDIRKLGFPDNHFDGIWCSAVLVHFDKIGIDKILNEFHRVQKRNGILFISVEEGHSARVERISPVGRAFITRFSKREFVELVQNQGYKILSVETSKDEAGRNFNWISIFAKAKNPAEYLWSLSKRPQRADAVKLVKKSRNEKMG